MKDEEQRAAPTAHLINILMDLARRNGMRPTPADERSLRAQCDELIGRDRPDTLAPGK